MESNFLGCDEVDSVLLEQEWRKSWTEERQREMEDFLNQPDSDAADCEKLERDYRQKHWTGEDWQRLHEFEAYNPEAVYDDVNSSVSTESCERTELMPAPTIAFPVSRGSGYISAPIAGIVLPATKSKISVTPYTAAQILIQSIPMVYTGKQWFIYQKGFYAETTGENVKRQIMDFWREEVAKAGQANFVDQVYRVLKSEPRVYADVDFNRNCVAFDDVVVDLERGEMIEPTPQIFVTTHINASYTRGCNSDCPTFKKFLADISGGDLNLQRRIWQMMGYTLVPDQAGKAFFLLQGKKNSGKSVLGAFITRCFDPQVVVSMTVNDFGKNFALAGLYGKKLCVDFDLPADPFGKSAVSYLKKMTGADLISSDVKFADRVNFKNSAKFLFATNHVVVLPNSDDAFFDRLVVIPFPYTTPAEQRDWRLLDKLDAERDAIVAQALVAYYELVRNNYCFAGTFPINGVTENGKANVADAVAQFLRDNCEFHPDAWTSTASLYVAFCRQFGKMWGEKIFSKMLSEIGKTSKCPIKKERRRVIPSANPVFGFAGLKLKENDL